MNEAETWAEYIDPKLVASWWGVVEGSRVLREFRSKFFSALRKNAHGTLCLANRFALCFIINPGHMIQIIRIGCDIAPNKGARSEAYSSHFDVSFYIKFLPRSKSADADIAAMDNMASVTGLAPGAVYHYRIVAEDESGNVSYSKDRTFETALEAVAIDNVPPEITEVSVTNVTASGATINWTTDELAQGHVEYGKTAESRAASRRIVQ